MKILVTGATGQIGSAVARHLLAAGHEVQGLARSDASAATLASAGGTPVRGDLADRDVLISLARAADGVIHVGYTWDAQAKSVETGATEAFIAALQGSGKPLITTCGAGILIETGEEPAGEDRAVPKSGMLWRAELERRVTEAEGLRGIVIRPSLVYDSAGHTLLKLLTGMSMARGAGVYVGDGRARWSTVHAGDIATLYALALDKAVPGTVLHAASGEISMIGLAEAISRALRFAGKTVSWPLEEAAKETPFATLLTHNIVISAERARKLGWRPERPSILAEISSII